MTTLVIGKETSKISCPLRVPQLMGLCMNCQSVRIRATLRSDFRLSSYSIYCCKIHRNKLCDVTKLCDISDIHLGKNTGIVSEL